MSNYWLDLEKKSYSTKKIRWADGELVGAMKPDPEDVCEYNKQMKKRNKHLWSEMAMHCEIKGCFDGFTFDSNWVGLLERAYPTQEN